MSANALICEAWRQHRAIVTAPHLSPDDLAPVPRTQQLVTVAGEAAADLIRS